MGIYRLSPGFLLHVESFHPAGWLPIVRHIVAALTQSAPGAARCAVTLHLEDGAFRDHPRSAAAHGNQVVQDQMGCCQTRRAGTALCERLTPVLAVIYSPRYTVNKLI